MKKNADNLKCSHSNDIIFDGKAAKFFRADMKALADLDAEMMAMVDQDMNELGFTLNGDMVCSAAPNMVIRGYGAERGDSFGFHIQQIGGDPYTEFFSVFENGACLTTTTQAGDSYPDLNIFRHIFEGMNPINLYRKHRDGISAFERDHKTRVVQIDATLLQAAKAIDDFLIRLS